MGKLIGESLAECYGVTQDHKAEEEQVWREKPKALQGIVWHGVWRKIRSMVWRSVCGQAMVRARLFANSCLSKINAAHVQHLQIRAPPRFNCKSRCIERSLVLSWQRASRIEVINNQRMTWSKRFCQESIKAIPAYEA